jgi:hypothetical protein
VIALAQLDSIASTIAGKPTTIVCRDFRDVPVSVRGYVLPDASGHITPTIYLPRSTCWRLEHLDAPRNPHPLSVQVYRIGGPEMDVADAGALATLTHECTHVRLDSTDELRVETAAFGERRRVLSLFPLTSRFRRALAVGWLWWHLHLPNAYVTLVANTE